MASKYEYKGMAISGIQGLPNAIRKLQGLDKAFGIYGDSLADVTFKGAKMIRDAARANIKHEVTGNLRRGTIAKKFVPGYKDRPSSFAGIDYSIAPHAHLYERGHITRDGSHTPGHPFFFDAVDKCSTRYSRMIKEAIQKSIMEAARK